MKLNAEAFARARAFLDAHARPVDRALFALRFEGAPGAPLIEAVAAYQNEDGGFGRSLEPDFRLHNSSVMATAEAFHYLIEAGAPGDHPVVQRGVAYLLAMLDKEDLSWLAVPVEVDVVPRAPWWTQSVWKDRPLADWANPNADCLAILLQYKDQVPSGALEALTGKAHAALAVMTSPCDMHAFLCWQRLARVIGEPFRGDILGMLREEAPKVVAADEAGWASYGLRPYWAVPDADDPLYPTLAQAVARNLDYEIVHQQADGSWAPFWEWGQYEDSWAVARAEWCGVLTVKVLTALKAFGRLEEAPKRGEVIDLP